MNRGFNPVPVSGTGIAQTENRQNCFGADWSYMGPDVQQAGQH